MILYHIISYYIILSIMFYSFHSIKPYIYISYYMYIYIYMLFYFIILYIRFHVIISYHIYIYYIYMWMWMCIYIYSSLYLGNSSDKMRGDISSHRTSSPKMDPTQRPTTLWLLSHRVPVSFRN